MPSSETPREKGEIMKRKLSDNEPPLVHNGKQVRTGEASPTDYSQDVKKKISASARTGQACDRCRIRKMRCDDQPNGCAPCMQNQSECKTTDRITGRATVRGYVQSLERRNEELENHVHELQARLMSLGEDVKPYHGYGDPTIAPLLQWHDSQRIERRPPWQREGHLGLADEAGPAISDVSDGPSAINISQESTARLPEFRTGLTGNNYLGVSTGNPQLSSIHGTSMNVLGMEIDLADYKSPDLDEPDPSNAGIQPVYNKSYRALVQTAFGTSPKLTKVELPPRSEGINHANIYFRVTNPYLPIVHKPSFIATLTRMYDDATYKPSVAEIVMVHTMFAIMYCQHAARAAQDPEHQAELNQSSNFHYHYALGFFPQLVNSHTLADVQALAMLCLHVRNFPKPGACFLITSLTLNLAIELGLHRSATRWVSTSEKNPLEIEIRKRVFWSLLVIHVIVAGNLGRPMALRWDDCDVEMPEAIDDELLSEHGIDTSRPGKCNFLVGLQALNGAPLWMDIYNDVYAVRRSPQAYVEHVLRLEKRIRDWEEHWPAELKPESAADNEFGRVHAQYLAIWPLHARLLLRHPSLSLTPDPAFNSENLTICMDVSKKMLGHVKQLQKYMSLDGTWQTGALYVLALSTTLFGHWVRKDQITTEEFVALKEDMSSWLSIIADMSKMLGSGKRLQDAVRVPVDRTLDLLNQHLASKVPALGLNAEQPALPPGRTLPPVHNSVPGSYRNVNEYPPYKPSDDGVSSHSQAENDSNIYPPPTVNATYPSQSQYGYHTSYGNNSSYQQPPYPSNDGLSATASAANAYLNHYPNQASSSRTLSVSSSNASYPNFSTASGPMSWRDFAGNMTSNHEPGAEYMSPAAAALVQLGGGRSQGEASQNIHQGVDMHHATNVDGGNAQPWPYMIFDSGGSGGTQSG